ncbi:VanZ family protein [Pelomonas sp. KK5]|uniref:VanZ family protein n=1 Tax=Pelomonas sp. KK5 TaxID=1855730 RepID=UPI00097C0E1F|nr:VanZ family protein [Pelomonas sp. KK5]
MKQLRALPFLVLLAVITWLALIPAPPPQADLGWDKANHFSAFAALVLSGRWAWPQRRAWPLALALLVYGGMIELIQTQLPPREGDWRDLLADAIGIAIGLLLCKALKRWFEAA